MNITILPILKDNYAYMIETDPGIIAVVDPGEAAPVIKWLEKNNKRLTHIINTHHHGDHIAGNGALRDKYGAILAAPKADAHRIDGTDIALEEGVVFTLGEEELQIIDTPGHTIGHIALYCESAKALFCGDTLFSMGCGRLFEGTAEQMWHSFEKIMALPDETRIYPGHEYTLSNGEFCERIEPDNQDLKKRISEVRDLRAQSKPTIPVSLATEKNTNAFLRARSAQRFAELRALKDQG